ncbi:hypothetical protein AYO44_15400 [Planctomycetaceae bacterium SCGC AG-212-F19]|nr:hypothetical protein AYO44_15400 [Planctomycetaceae bacterium SCGC AG-212-F19]
MPLWLIDSEGATENAHCCIGQGTLNVVKLHWRIIEDLNVTGMNGWLRQLSSLGFIRYVEDYFPKG